MAVASARVAATMTGVSALGRTCCRRMRGPVAPIERAADADGDRLLADVAVHDAVDLACQIVGRSALLEAADREHPAQHLALRVGRQVGRKALHERDPSEPVRAFYDGPALEGWQPERPPYASAGI